jgi:hypothetical protein
MACPQPTPEDLEAAYTLLLMSQLPVNFDAPSVPATWTGVEHQRSSQSSKQARKTHRGNKGPTTSTLAIYNPSGKTLSQGKSSHFGKEKAMKLTVSQEYLVGKNISLIT